MRTALAVPLWWQPVILVAYLASAGALSVAGATVYLGRVPSVAVCAVSAGIIFGIYMINRFTDVKEDLVNWQARALFLERGRAVLYMGIAALATSTLLLAVTGKLNAYHMLLAAVGIVYSCRILPVYSRARGMHFVRLKDLPMMKNLLVAGLWGGSVFVVPVLFLGIEVRAVAPVVFLAGAKAVAVFTNTLFKDIRDVAGDALVGARTVPCMIGESRTYVLMAALNLVWLTAATALTWGGRVDSVHFLLSLFLVLYTWAYIIAYRTVGMSPFWIEWAGDSTSVVFALGLVFLA